MIETPIKTIRVLSLGAGVQSTTIALLVADGRLPKLDGAIFADTQEEPQAVYKHLEWLMEETKHAFPTLVRTIGKLGDNLVRGVNGRGGRFISIPAYTKHPVDDSHGIKPRQCTAEYKVAVVERCIRRELLNLPAKRRVPKGTSVTQVVGLSAEEGRRVLRVRARIAATPFSSEFPLFDMHWTRANCLGFLEGRVPHPVPKSACVFCPYHGNAEWRDIRAFDKPGWDRAVQIDEAIRTDGCVSARGMDHQMYVHRSCVPLKDADLSGPDPKPLQYGLGFERECVGMCGV